MTNAQKIFRDWCEANGIVVEVLAAADLVARIEAGTRAAPAQQEPVAILRDEVLSRVAVFRDHEPEDGESWESWYFSAFDLLIMEISKMPSAPPADAKAAELAIGPGHPVFEKTRAAVAAAREQLLAA